MFKRGKATSGDPICSGIIAFAKPANNEVANKKSIKVPCIVNSWLYCSLLTNCRPGRASSARITSAINPAIAKKANDVTMYRFPMTLWSVEVIQPTTLLPFFTGGRNGACEVVVTGLSKIAIRRLLLLQIDLSRACRFVRVLLDLQCVRHTQPELQLLHRKAFGNDQRHKVQHTYP